ncbi:DUF6597 domain-containing transcriptional factor [Spirosoma sp.]|uniref:DUF6597 domain-containing transcriptional factor n=1 Tax=Spirosoma sp. TaxID=1899569 RepID=UPI003B3BDFD5
MKYEKIPPPVHLKRYVEYFWICENKHTSSASKTFRPITDGCPGLIVPLYENELLFDQNKKQLPTLCLYGQTIKHREIHAIKRMNVMGVCFSPVALKSIFGLDADELTDTCTDLSALGGQQPLFLAEQLINADSVTCRIDLLSAYLINQISRNRAQHDNVTHQALSRLIISQGSVSLKELQDELNVSERYLERKFKQGIGVSPKLFARICRFQASLQQLKTSNYDKLSDIAFENGYADQSHFIRVFKEFAGFSPYRYRKQANEVVENFAEWL